MLQTEHVSSYLTHAQRGISQLPPEHLANLLKEGKLSTDKSTGLLHCTDKSTGLLQSTNEDPNSTQSNGEDPVSQFTNYLHSPHDQVDLPIIFSNGESVLITFSGEGYHPREQTPLLGNEVPPLGNEAPSLGNEGLSLGNEAPLTANGDIKSSTNPPSSDKHKQLVRLSESHFDLGHLPLFAVVRRLVFLRNCSPHTLSYHWYFSAEVEEDEVVDESESLSHQLLLSQWEEEEEERRHTFTIASRDQQQHKKIKQRAEGHPQISSVHKLPHVSGDRPSSSDSDLRGSQFQVLPPIGAHCVTYEEWKKMDLCIKTKGRPKKEKSSHNKPPSPPPSSIWGSLLTHTLSSTTPEHSGGWINSSSTTRPKFPPQNALLDLV